MPRYQEIYLELAERIRTGTYLSGTLLPGEHRLMEEFDVSRDTVRKALSLLSRSGYIEKARGRGSTVLPTFSPDSAAGPRSFTEFSAAHGTAVSTLLLSMDRIMPDAVLLRALGCKEDTPVYRLVRLRCSEGKPQFIETDYLNGTYLKCPDIEQAQGSIYSYIETVCRQHITAIRKQTTCIEADEQDCTHLNVSKGSMIVRMRSVVMNKSGAVLMYAVTHHDPRTYVYVEFQQRSLKL